MPTLKDLLQNEAPHAYIQLFDDMTNSERNILSVFTYFGELNLMGKIGAVFPSKATIAEMAGCGERTVGTFIKKYEGKVFNHEQRRKAGTVKKKSNKYHLNMAVVEMAILLKYNNYYHCWKEKRLEVMEKMMLDHEFLVKKTMRSNELRTTKLPMEMTQKLPSIKSFLKNSNLYNSTPKGSSQNNVQKVKKTTGVFADIPLTYEQMKRLERCNAMIDLEEARKQHNKYVYTWGNKVDHPYWFMQKQAHKNYMKRVVYGK